VSEAVESDWRAAMMAKASKASTMISTRERARNPLIPDNFLDLSGAGFPSDLIVLAVQIPRAQSPAEQQQYRNMTNAGWLHVPWNAISENGGADGKAVIPAADRHVLGRGEEVACLAGHYLMFANRQQYLERRARNVARTSEHLEYKMTEMEEKDDYGRKFSTSDSSGPMTVDELLEYEKRLGDEPARKGEHIES